MLISANRILRSLVTVIVLFIFLNLLLVNIANAGNSINRTRGAQSPAATIWWQVIAGSGLCNPSFNGAAYPAGAGDNVWSDWTSGLKSLTGSLAFNQLNAVGTYVFRCTHTSGSAYDEATLTVDDCTLPLVWNGSNACVAAVPANIFISVPANVTVGSPATLSWSTTDAASIDINSCTGNAAAVAAWTQIGINGAANLPNGSKTVIATAAMVGGSVTCSAIQAFGPGGASAPRSFTWTVSAAAAPIPSLTISAAGYGTNVHSISYPAGTPNTKDYSSTGGVSWSSDYQRTGSCVNNSFGGNTAWAAWISPIDAGPGVSNGVANEGDVGCLINLRYTATNASSISASDQVDVTVNRCLDTKYYQAGTGCIVCSNGGCTGLGGNPGDPDGSLTCNNGSPTVPLCPIGLTSGTLIAASPTCNVPAGVSGTTCPINFNWTTTNPVTTSFIWRDDLGIGTPITSGNSGGPLALNVRYATSTGNGTRTFYLRNNGIDIAQSTVTANCSGGESWVGGVCTPPPPGLPTATTPTAVPLTTGATLGANITSDGGSGLTERGTCWGTTPAPFVNCIPEGSTSLGIFSHARSGMAPGTTYYMRGYGRNASGYGFTADLPYTTLANVPGVITVTPQACGTGQNFLDWPDALGATSYSVYNAGSGAFIGNSIGSNYTHTGSISTAYTYFVRSNNSVGAQSANSPTSASVSTLGACAGGLTATTNAASGISQTSATLNGSGFSSWAANGLTTGYFRWGTSFAACSGLPFQVIATTPVGGGINSVGFDGPTAFNANLTGLTAATTYYYCAAVQALTGTWAYGGTGSFATAAASYSCTGGPLPINASFYPGDNPPISSSVGMSYSAAPTATECEFRCGTGAGGYTWSGVICQTPVINYFEICDSDGVSNCNVSRTVPPNTPLVARWDADYADSCVRLTGPVDFSTLGVWNNGSDAITSNLLPGSSDIYRLQCTKDSVAITGAAQVTINTSLLNPTLTSSQTIVKIGSTVTLTWDTNNGDETLCSLVGGGISYPAPPGLPAGGNQVVGSEGETGSVSGVLITGRTTFTLTCPSGTAIKTVDVIPQNGET